MKFQSRMRNEALKQAQMNPKIVMMKKNERVDKNNSTKNTYEMFRSTNPVARREVAQFLEGLKDPFLRQKEVDINNYSEIKELKTTLSNYKGS
jgi:hypothetical protein